MVALLATISLSIPNVQTMLLLDTLFSGVEGDPSCDAPLNLLGFLCLELDLTPTLPVRGDLRVARLLPVFVLLSSRRSNDILICFSTGGLLLWHMVMYMCFNHPASSGNMAITCSTNSPSSFSFNLFPSIKDVKASALYGSHTTASLYQLTDLEKFSKFSKALPNMVQIADFNRSFDPFVSSTPSHSYGSSSARCTSCPCSI
mmetsp:Transcript_229/g.492  ORF Transcript_229/g.492 Transcript_229/m.492 type:complete len:202 (-) Transcript_229:292-897(-)